MKKIIIKIALISLLLISYTSCDDFGDINIDPNATTQVAPETILTSSLRSLSTLINSPIPTYYAQYISDIVYTEESRYNTVNWDFNWIYSYLRNLEKIIELNTDEYTKDDALQSGSNNNQIAVARILKSYIFLHITDRWGPIPYSEALKGSENFKPSYDSQEMIYDGCFKELKEAINQMDNGSPVKGDFIFGGNMSMWTKFANSIRMVAAMRISKVDPLRAESEFLEALNDGVLESNSESIMYPYLAESNNENPWYSSFRTRTDYALSSTLVNKLFELNDPRLYSYGDPNQTSGDYQGMPYGISNPVDDPADVSFPNSQYVRAQDAPLPILTYAQILLCMTEAAHLGWINTPAEELYNEAIQASMKQWYAFESNVYNDYISQPKVTWDPGKADERIGTQKWIALFPSGFESWSEWRRIGFPTLNPAPDALSASKEIPLRQGYPTSERDLNADNWQNAVDTWFGGVDDLHLPVWWDIN